MQNEKSDDVTAEMLMQQVEELLLMDELSEGEKTEILKGAPSIVYNLLRRFGEVRFGFKQRPFSNI